MTFNANEKAAHRALGFGASLIGMFRKLVVEREVRQMPMENKASPEIFVSFDEAGDVKLVSRVQLGDGNDLLQPYWAAIRVKDSIKDISYAAQLAPLASVLHVGIGVLIGWLVF